VGPERTDRHVALGCIPIVSPRFSGSLVEFFMTSMARANQVVIAAMAILLKECPRRSREQCKTILRNGVGLESEIVAGWDG